MSPRVFVMTSDDYLWAIKPFAYLFNIYWSELQEVVVGCFKLPDFKLPDNFRLFQIDRHNYPANFWSDALSKLLKVFKDEQIVFMLEDYWLCRTVDTRGVATLAELANNFGNVLRVDLTDDRLYAGGKFDIGAYGHYDIIETLNDVPYQMSTQAGIWNTKLLLDILIPNKSAWEVEMHTCPPSTMRVIGTRQCPVRYANAILKGKLNDEEIARIPQPHRNDVLKMIPHKVMKNERVK